jgi:hypothetical protein
MTPVPATCPPPYSSLRGPNNPSYSCDTHPRRNLTMVGCNSLSFSSLRTSSRTGTPATPVESIAYGQNPPPHRGCTLNTKQRRNQLARFWVSTHVPNSGSFATTRRNQARRQTQTWRDPNGSRRALVSEQGGSRPGTERHPVRQRVEAPDFESGEAGLAGPREEPTTPKGF